MDYKWKPGPEYWEKKRQMEKDWKELMKVLFGEKK